MGINVNDSDLGDDEAVVPTITTNVNSAARATEVTLSAGGNNTITATYYVSNPGDTGLFQRRWIDRAQAQRQLRSRLGTRSENRSC